MQRIDPIMITGSLAEPDTAPGEIDKFMATGSRAEPGRSCGLRTAWADRR